MAGTLSLFDWRPVPGLTSELVPEPAQVPDAGQSPAPAHPPAKRGRRASSRAAVAIASTESQVEPSTRPPAELALVPPLVDAVAPQPFLAEGTGPHAQVVIRPEARVVVFDCETTGTDRLQDQVIELCVQRGLSDDAPSQTWRIKPNVAIHPGAQAVHGITQAELEGCPTFASLADEITAVFAEAEVIVGYNIAFDIDMLQAEYTRIGRPLLDLSGKKIVDAFRLWQQCEPRSLQHAHQRFVGNGFASAHSASADVAATGRVLSGMLRAFNLADQDWEAIACKCDPQHGARASWLGPSRHLRWEGEAVVIGFGKHSNAVLHQLAAGPDRSFLRWVVERDFPIHVGEICRAALDMAGEEFLAWARRKYPPPAVVIVVEPTAPK